LYKNFGIVKGVGFDSGRRVGAALPAVRVYNLRDVDELIILDIAATVQRRPIALSVVESLAAECSVPLTFGGGIETLAQIQDLLAAGVDKVCINSAAYMNPGLIEQASGRFGSQCVVVSIDVRRDASGRYVCYSHAGREHRQVDVVAWARRVRDLGAGELLVTSIERDGTMSGYDLELIRAVVDAVDIPVIAGGGAGSYHDFLLALREAGAAAVAAGSMFHFTEQTPNEAKRYLAEAGVAVRHARWGARTGPAASKACS